jgi:trans-aconitate 2-methyltransferase
MWSPEVYLRFADERGRPFHELVARIGAPSRGEGAPARVLDLGCGPGNLTQTLTRRWPEALVHGVDSSPEMIEEARAKTAGVTYEVADAVTYEVPDEVDVIVTNALLHWIPGHDELLGRWVKPGRWIAMQVPANYAAPSHLLLRDVCASPHWAGRLGDLNRARVVGDAVHYGRLLRAAGCAVDTWETNYVHQLPVLPDRPHPVLTWMTGTALRPVRSRLDDAEWEEFCAELDNALWTGYPADGDVVDFPFLRVFAVAHRER